MEENRFCRKCILSDMPENSLYNTIRDYIDDMDKELRADKNEYENRLYICRECNKLINGMCRVCGCFVEMRAARADGYCPDSIKRW